MWTFPAPVTICVDLLCNISNKGESWETWCAITEESLRRPGGHHKENSRKLKGPTVTIGQNNSKTCLSTAMHCSISSVLPQTVTDTTNVPVCRFSKLQNQPGIPWSCGDISFLTSSGFLCEMTARRLYAARKICSNLWQRYNMTEIIFMLDYANFLESEMHSHAEIGRNNASSHATRGSS